MTFNPAVWQLTGEQDLRGHNWKNEGAQVKKIRNVGSNAEEELLFRSNSQVACGSSRAVLTFSKSNGGNLTWQKQAGGTV